MMRIVKATLIVVAVFIAASVLTRFLISSGIVKAGLESPIGSAAYSGLRHLFPANGMEEAEGLIISATLTLSLLLVSLATWTILKLWHRLFASNP